jgi:hypothetical protein
MFKQWGNARFLRHKRSADLPEYKQRAAHQTKRILAKNTKK